MSSGNKRPGRKAALTSSASSSKKAKVATAGGTDSEGRSYSSVDELWQREFLGGQEGAKEGAAAAAAAGGEKKGAWYRKGADYWMSQAASVDGVLGGFGHISPVDLSGSKSFLASIPGVQYGRAIDCGAGIGRISKGLLCPLFKQVDLVEQNPLYVAKAREYCAGLPTMREYYTQGLQDFSFEPQAYDVIWIQWVIGHLPDADFVPFMRRCVLGLRPGGLVVLKENNARDGFVMDLEDQSLTRTDEQYRRLFEQADMDLVKTELQKNFPAALFPVRMYALRPKKQDEQTAAPAAAAAAAQSSAAPMDVAAGSAQ